MVTGITINKISAVCPQVLLKLLILKTRHMKSQTKSQQLRITYGQSPNVWKISSLFLANLCFESLSPVLLSNDIKTPSHINNIPYLYTINYTYVIYLPYFSDILRTLSYDLLSNFDVIMVISALALFSILYMYSPPHLLSIKFLVHPSLSRVQDRTK